jgi:acyl dehydratase
VSGPAERAEGPFFDELAVGDAFAGPSGLTLTDGLAAVHAGVVADRLRLGLDHDLSRRLTGQDRPLASPALVWDVAIGQSTVVTHHVVANLFYRGLSFRRMPCLGDTLRTLTQVVGLRQSSARPGRPATGLAALRITTVDQADRPVLDFWRCAMLPLRDGAAVTGWTDDMAAVGRTAGPVPDPTEGWHLDAVRALYPPDLRTTGLAPGQSWEVVGGDVVSSAPELARATLNTARVHHDDGASGAGRLVYGGHTVGLALSQAVRALPDLVTVLSWQSCDHLGPVREGDTITSRVEVESVEPAVSGRHVRLRSLVQARGGPDGEPRPVLDWRFTALLP